MLQINNISFSYQNTSILKNISFNAQVGQYTAVIGESGSGKSTLLKLLRGEYDLNEGHIFWKEKEILGPKYNLVVGYDFIKYVAQEFELMPFISVAENIGKYLSNVNKEEKKERITELLEIVELTAFVNTKVKLLSGGQKQRVALARAFAKEPEIILLDEPFSHIDNFKKQTLRRNVFSYLKKKKITCIVATHNHEDVLGFADSMIVLNNNKIIINDSPENLYKNPKTPLVASFFGEFNVIDNKIIYAHQLQVVEKSDLKAYVKHAYYKGNYYLIEANSNTKTIFFKHHVELKKHQRIYLQIVL